MIQIRNVPERVHARLKEKANQAGMNLSDYLKDEVTRIAESLTWAEVAERMGPHQVRISPEDVAATIRQDRDAR